MALIAEGRKTPLLLAGRGKGWGWNDRVGEKPSLML
jgi:hypothetical protein